MLTLLHGDLDLGSQDLKRASCRFNGLEQWKDELETLSFRHSQVNVDLTLLELDHGRLGIHLLCEDGQVDMGLGLVPTR